MIRLIDAVTGYPSGVQIGPVQLHVPQGKLVVLVGPNGSGKSTLLKAMAGQLPVTQGSIRLKDENLQQISGKKRARIVAYLPQSRPVPSITVQRLVLHGRFPYMHYPRKYRLEDMTAATDAMKAMDLLPIAQKSLVALSGGERQKAYLAMLLAQETEILLLDEPTTFLDVHHQLEVMEKIKELKQAGKTIFLVLHDINMAMQYADSVAVMEEGKLLAIETPSAVLESGVLEQVFHIRLEQYTTAGGAMGYCCRRQNAGQ